MKNKGTRFLKKMMEVLAAVAKAKSITLKSKMRALKTRLIIYSLLRDKKVLFGSISHKLHGTLLEEKQEQSNLQAVVHTATPAATDVNIVHEEYYLVDDHQEAAAAVAAVEEEEEENERLLLNQEKKQEEEEEEEEEEEKVEDEDYEKNNKKHPDLRQPLTLEDIEDDEEYDEMGRPAGSVIELVKKSKELGREDHHFRLEDEIDEIADLFIKRFHRHMWIQKQNSFKRRQLFQNPEV